MGRLLLVGFAALALAGAAAARTADHNQVKLNAADQAAARKTVIRLSELTTDWKGGAVKPDVNDVLVCANYHPKQADLVLTGIAEAKYSSLSAQLDSEMQVFRTAAMVALDWPRSVLNPALVSCLGATSPAISPRAGVRVGRPDRPSGGDGVLTREYRFVLVRHHRARPAGGSWT